MGGGLEAQAAYSPFLHYPLVPSLKIINIGNTGNQNHGRGVLVTCISNIDFLKAGNQLIMQKR